MRSSGYRWEQACVQHFFDDLLSVRHYRRGFPELVRAGIIRVLLGLCLW